ncbi:nitrate ABC transporter permease [Pseudoclavibacter endophyticus]|uniref:ABC transporter permease n=1 Tax=Pseudoclavibacter endophyticus TaxID=1778590 RepID=A0A6H9WK28_9MICO|nr:ABC transporter permease [Pseudoclavibacter endophyticus]KAB1647802.1 ABC transporter permease [Pseudoclavibacter endophyticus]GGA72943.1 nitrate ABC transporter permease [Pseudoclavibacter endophyticus]
MTIDRDPKTSIVGLKQRPSNRPGLPGWLRKLGVSALVLVVFLVVWEIAGRLLGSPFFPPFSSIVTRFFDLWFSGPASSLFLTDRVGSDLVPSLGRLFSGWALGAALGVLFGLLIGRYRTFGYFVEPFVHFARAIPPPALLPIFFILLGIDNTMMVSLIAFAVVWPVLLNTIDGVRAVESLHIDTASVFEFGRMKVFFSIMLPSAAPKIFAGLRVSLAIALIVMVVAEMTSSSGLGYNVVNAQRTYNFLDMWAGILVLGILGYVLNTVLALVENRVTRWHKGSREGLS